MTLPYYKMQNISHLHNTSIEKGVISELLVVISVFFYLGVLVLTEILKKVNKK